MFHLRDGPLKSGGGGGGRKKLHANRLEEKILHEKYAQEKILTDVRKKIPAIQSWEKSFKQKIPILPPLTYLSRDFIFSEHVGTACPISLASFRLT